MNRVSDKSARALVSKWRELFPGAGFPSLETAKELLVAAMGAEETGAEAAFDRAVSRGLFAGLAIKREPRL